MPYTIQAKMIVLRLSHFTEEIRLSTAALKDHYERKEPTKSHISIPESNAQA